jgi:hypothetical protein
MEAVMAYLRLAAICAAAALLWCGSVLAKDENPGRADGQPAAGQEKPSHPARPPEGMRDEGREGHRPPMRVPNIFRNVTDQDIADIFAFVDEYMPWMRPDLEKVRDTDFDHFRQVCRNLRFEIAQLKNFKTQDEAAFRKAIEEKQLRYRAQDLAAKARAATDPKEREALVEALRGVVDQLLSAEFTTRAAQIRQLEHRLDDLRQDLKQREASRQTAVNNRIEELLKPKGPDAFPGFSEKRSESPSRPADKPRQPEKSQK